MKVAEEKVKLAVMSYQVNKEETTLYAELIKIEGLSEITPSDENSQPPYIVVVDGYKFRVKEDLSIEYLGKENDAIEKLPEITKVEYETTEVTGALTVSITAKTEDFKGLKEINVYHKKVEGEKITLEKIETKEVSGKEATITVEIPINGDYVIHAVGQNNKIGTKEISISNIKEGSVLASITGGEVTNEAKATIQITGRGQGRAIQKMELFVDGKSAATYDYKDVNTVREESYTLENLEFYKDVPCYVKTWDSKGEEKTSATKIVSNTKIIKTAYEDRVKGLLDTDEFVSFTESYKKEKQELMEKTEKLNTKLSDYENNRENELMKYIREIVSFKEINRNIILNLVDTIEIIDKENIKINYKFAV